MTHGQKNIELFWKVFAAQKNWAAGV